MNKPERLTDHDLRILREVAGELPPSPWGAAVGEALGYLVGRGYLTRKFGGRPTEAGHAALVEARQAGR